MPAPDPLFRRAFLAVLAGALLLGFSAIFVRWAQEAEPAAIGFYRMAIALPLTLLLAWRTQDPGPAPPAEVHPGSAGGPHPVRGALWATLGGLLFTTDLFLWQTAIRHTSAANATLLIGLAPLWVALFSVAFLRTRLRAGAWMGFALALAGAAILGLAKGARPGSGYGEMLSALASFCYGGYTLCLGLARRDLSGPWAMTWVSFACIAGFALLALLSGAPLTGFSPQTWAALAGLGLVVQVAAWWFISWGLGHVPTSLGALGLLLQQVATVGLAWLLLGERPLGLQAAGIVLVIAGIGLSTVFPPRRAEGPRTP